MKDIKLYLLIPCILFLLILLINCPSPGAQDETPEERDPELGVSKTSLSFDVIQGDTATCSFRVSNRGDETVEWEATTDQAWLSINPTSGVETTGSTLVSINIDTAPLAM